MKIFGLEISRTAKALSPVPTRGWWSVIKEAFTGAWQRNIEERRETVLCYPTLYACLSRIAQDIGKLPFQLKFEDKDGIWKLDRSASPFWPVLRKPNHYQTAQQFREAWELSKLSHGNAYVLKEYDGRGIVTKMHVLDPCNVMPMVSDSGDVFYQLNYGTAQNLLPMDYPAAQLVVPASQIIHDRMNCFHHPLIGVPPLCAAHWPAVKNLKILRNATTFFSNGANPGGILTAPAGLSDDDAAAIKEYWNTNFQGANSGKIAVMGADMKFTSFAFKAVDSQLVEQMRYSDEQICQPFGIPPFKIGIGSIPAGLGVDAINQLYYADALQANIEAMEALLDEGLGITKGDDGRLLGVELDLWPLLRMDVGKQAEVETKLTGGGIKTPNEGRFAFGLSPLEGGDTVYMQQQDFPLDQVRKNKIEQAPAPEPESEPEPAPEPDADADADAEELKQFRSRETTRKAIAAAREEALTQ